jgi:hypothetical protein
VPTSEEPSKPKQETKTKKFGKQKDVIAAMIAMLNAKPAPQIPGESQEQS